MRTSVVALLVFSASSVAAFAPSAPGAAALAARPPAQTSARDVVLMAVPKSRTSKMKTRARKANWLAKAKLQSASPRR